MTTGTDGADQWQGGRGRSGPYATPMHERYYVTLDQAADELGVSAVDLFAKAVHGIVWVGLIGTTWVTTRQEIERVRSERLRHRDRSATAARPG